MDSAVVAGAFGLGGVALGAALNWLRTAAESRGSASGKRDETFEALGAACVRLLVEARTWRSLDKPASKARQALYGVLEGEARHPFKVSDDLVAVLRQVGASAVVYGLKHQMPVSVAQSIRSDLMPLLSEIAVLAIRLSMMGDEGLKDAADRITDATGALVENLAARNRDYAKQEAEVQAAIGQLRRARDAAAARRWYRRWRRS
jgi:hypothetical protein